METVREDLIVAKSEMKPLASLEEMNVKPHALTVSNIVIEKDSLEVLKMMQKSLEDWFWAFRHCKSIVDSFVTR